jgi:plasmid stabilization system protein ParE
MRVEYSIRATADLRKVSADSLAFGETVAAAVEMRIREIVIQLANAPESAPRVVERPGVRVVPLVRYPYKIFYRVFKDRVRILQIAAVKVGRLALDLHQPSGPRLRNRVAINALNVGYRETKCLLRAQLQSSEICRFGDRQVTWRVEHQPDVHVSQIVECSHFHLDLPAIG